MAKTLYSDFLHDDGAFDKFIKKLNRAEADYTASIDEMIEVSKELGIALRNALNVPKPDLKNISSLISQTKGITRELNATKAARNQLNTTKKKYIDLTNEEREAIAKDKIATQELRRETELIERVRRSEIGTLARLRAEINKEAYALDQMVISSDKARRAAEKLRKSLESKRRALREAEIASGKLNANVGNYPKVARVAASAMRSLVAAFGLYSGLNIARSIFNEIKEVESLNLALKTVTRTTAEYNASQLFLRDIAQNYGVEINRLTGSYIKFAASLKDTGITLVQGKDLFESVAKSSAVLGVSAEDTEGALKALGQILSKGKVQAEELRGQLGDRLFGVMQIVADVTGKTTAELDKMLETGQLLAVDVLPKLAKGFENAYNTEHIKTVDTLNARTNQLSNAWNFLIRSIDQGNGFISKTFKNFTGGLTGLVELLTKVNERTDLKDTILGDNYFGAIAGGGAKAQLRINATIDEIIRSFEKLQKEATSKDFLSKINSEIEVYEKTLAQLEEKSKSGNLNIIDAAINEGEIDIILYQLQRLRILTIEAKEAEKQRAEEAKKYSDQVEKTYKNEALAAIAARLKKEEENARLGKMKEITQEQKFQAEITDETTGLYTDQETAILARNQAMQNGLDSAARTKEQAEELLRILEQQKEEERIKSLNDSFNTLINFIDQASEAAYNRRLQRINDETKAQGDAVTEQQKRFREGLKNTLDFEEKELVKQELKKQQIQKRNERRQKVTLFFNTANSLIQGGAPPLQAYAQAGAQVLTAEVFAASLREGGILDEVISTKGGSSKFGAIDRGYVTGVTHENKSGGIPVLMERNEGVISSKGMKGYENRQQFKDYHEFLRNGGKHNDLLKAPIHNILKIDSSNNDNREILEELRGINKGLGSLEQIKIDSKLHESLPKIVSTLKWQGKQIEEIYTGGSYKNSRGTSSYKNR